MKIRIIKRDGQELLFCCIWGFYSIFGYVLSISELSYMYDLRFVSQVVTYVTIAALLFLLVNKYTRKKAFIYMAFLLLIFLIEVNITDRSFLIYILLIMSMPTEHFDKFLSFDVKLKTACAIVVFGMCALGITNNYIHITGFTAKQALGFSHPNTMSTFVYAILLEWLYLHYKKMKVRYWIAILGIWFIIYYLAASRTVAYTFLFVYIFFIIANVKPGLLYKKTIHIAFVSTFPIMALLSLGAVSLYNSGNQTIVYLSYLMSNRIKIMAAFMERYDVRLFGQEIELIGSRMSKLQNVKPLILDNAYIRCLLLYGGLYFVLLCIAYPLLTNYLMRKQQIALVLICVYYAIIGFGEFYMLNPIYNVGLLCLLGMEKIPTYKSEKVQPRHSVKCYLNRVPRV